MLSVLKALDDHVRRVSPRRLFWTVIVIDVVLIVLLVALVAGTAVFPSEARITVEADTEIAAVSLPAEVRSFAWGELAVDPTALGARAADCRSPTIDLSEPLTGPIDMRATVTAGAGDLVVVLKRASGDIGQLACAGGSTIGSGPFLRFRWTKDAARDVGLKFAGLLTVGDVAPDGDPIPRLLRGGAITVEASSAPLSDGSVSSVSKLYPGDRVQVFAAGDERRQSLSHGLLRMGRNGRIDVTAHAQGIEARVLHVGNEQGGRSSIAPTFWAKLQAQPEWTLALLVGALLLNMASVMRSYREEVAAVPRGALNDGAP